MGKVEMKTIRWKGWTTSFDSLKAEGWVITTKPKFENWRLPIDSARSTEKIYVRHPENRMIGRISKVKKSYDYKILTDSYPIEVVEYELDYLIQEHNQWKSAPKIFEERNLTADDIPKLLQLILELQEPLKVKKKIPPQIRQQAEILLLRQA